MVGEPQPPRGEQWLRVAAIRLPRISNSTDVEALACEPGVLVRWVTDPADLADADVVVIPGSKATVADLAVAARARTGRRASSRTPRSGGRCSVSAAASRCCAGASTTPSSRAWAASTASGLLDADIEFAPDKTLRRHEAPLHGYEIHHGQVVALRRGRLARASGIRRGARSTARTGTACSTTTTCGATGSPTPPRRRADADSWSPTTSTSPARRDAQLDLMADLLAAHVDIDAVLGLLDGGPPERPTVRLGRCVGSLDTMIGRHVVVVRAGVWRSLVAGVRAARSRAPRPGPVPAWRAVR